MKDNELMYVKQRIKEIQERKELTDVWNEVGGLATRDINLSEHLGDLKKIRK